MNRIRADRLAEHLKTCRASSQALPQLQGAYNISGEDKEVSEILKKSDGEGEKEKGTSDPGMMRGSCSLFAPIKDGLSTPDLPSGSDTPAKRLKFSGSSFSDWVW